ncbi:MAG: hypothetical protein ACRCZ0_10155 [Cetobacterium sp.]
MKTYEKINRDYFFSPEESIYDQHNKIDEEFNEVDDEMWNLKYSQDKNPTDSITDYVNEMLDLQMAINNQLIRVERDYGVNFLKECILDWESKMRYYVNVKYKDSI